MNTPGAATAFPSLMRGRDDPYRGRAPRIQHEPAKVTAHAHTIHKHAAWQRDHAPGEETEGSGRSHRPGGRAIMVPLGVRWWRAQHADTHQTALPRPAAATRPSAPRAATTPGVQQLKGKWLRPDGGYMLDVRDAMPAGRWRREGQGGLPDLRGGARRGRDAARPGRRALRGRAFAPRRGRTRDLQPAAGHGRRPRHDDDRRGPLPEHRRRAARGGAGPDDQARPGRARQPLRHGRDRHRPPRARRRAPLRGRRMRLHRPARRQPARVELAQRMLRVRPPGRAERARRPAARRGEPVSRRPGRGAEPRDPPGRVAARRPERDAADLDELGQNPYPLARLVAISAKAREETRGSHARAEFPQLDPRLDHRHTILDPGSETPRFETWP